MFQENVDKKPLLNNTKVTKDSYILYKGKMVSSNLIDIEVIFNKEQTIRRKIMVDTHDDIRALSSQICEVCDIFPKLSGLNSLISKDFKKKTENGFIELKTSGFIGDSILPKDVIYFNLVFYEVWLDIEMNLECGSRSYKIRFDLKVVLNSNQVEFENTLINLGIKSWAKIVTNNYYAFTELKVDYPPKAITKGNNALIISKNNTEVVFNMSNGNAANDNIVSFDFDSKLTCKLLFTDISETVYDYLSTSDRGKSRSIGSFIDMERSKAIKNYFNDFFPKWLSNKGDVVALYDHILWRYQLPNLLFDDEENNSSFDSEERDFSFNCSDVDIEVNRITSNGNILPGGKNGNLNSNKLSCFGSTLELRGKSFQNDLKGTNNQLMNQKFKKEFYFINNSIDYNDLLAKLAALYIPFKEFESKSPDTRNLVELCNGVIEQFETEPNETNILSQKEDIWINSDKRWMKKWGWTLSILLVIILIYIFLF